jgi:putative drug exporter of the RND superfamily
MLGLGIALAIIADTLFIRLTLLPAIMVYLGKANWWWPAFGKGGTPKRGRRRRPKAVVAIDED